MFAEDADADDFARTPPGRARRVGLADAYDDAEGRGMFSCGFFCGVRLGGGWGAHAAARTPQTSSIQPLRTPTTPPPLPQIL